MSESQCTLARPVEIQGVGLFFGQPVQLRCRPAPAGSGIVFVRADLPGQPQIPAVIANVPPGPQRWTALRERPGRGAHGRAPALGALRPRH